MARRLTPEEDYQIPRNLNNPENDIEGAVGGAIGGRHPHREDNALSFRHFLQPHSDVVPLPQPLNWGRGNRGGVDLVDVTMGLPDFVQDHLVLESLAGSAEPSQDMSPTRPYVVGHPLDLNVLDNVPEFSSSQRNPHSHRASHSQRRNTQQETGSTGHPDNPHGVGIALPDFLSDGPMQLNQEASANSPSPLAGSNRGARSRPQGDNGVPEIPVRDESNESLRVEIERLRVELAEKNHRVNHLEAELTRQRSASASLETSLRLAERNLSDANGRIAHAEQRLRKSFPSRPNGEGDVAVNGEGIALLDASSVLSIARTSESLISQLLQNVDELKRLSTSSTVSGKEKETRPRNNR